jgi:hypothetical protein
LCACGQPLRHTFRIEPAQRAKPQHAQGAVVKRQRIANVHGCANDRTTEFVGRKNVACNPSRQPLASSMSSADTSAPAASTSSRTKSV